MKTVRRNSSIELLRLLAMLMVVCNHFVQYSPLYKALPYWPAGITKFVFQVVFMSGGWFGDVLFFAISVWFLLDKTTGFRDSCRRVWVLERELLFWSLILFGLTVFAKWQGIYQQGIAKLAVESVFPIASGLWWYPTSYALFLLFMPFLVKGLRVLGKRSHCVLSVVMLLLWSNLISLFPFDAAYPSVLLFTGWAVAIAYYRWYIKPLSTKACLLLVLVGLGVASAYWTVANVFSAVTGAVSFQTELAFCYRTPGMLMAFGVFLLAERAPFYSGVLNWIAQSAFGVYLIHCYPSTLNWWSHSGIVDSIVHSNHPLLGSLCFVLTLFLICLLLDIVRHLLFTVSLDRRRGRMFDVLFARIEKTRWYCRFIAQTAACEAEEER